ncbi:MAG: ABC transporter substrate-binding protein [Eubacteriales bacterium]|nr:ABC transporter substrate-binding protein [Eubacteriales bacterium]
MKWKKRALALLVAGLAALGGCDRARSDGGALVDDVPVSDAYFGLAWYQNGTLDPVRERAAVDRVLCEALYEGLFEVTDNFTAEPVLCDSYTGDGTTFTFTLRDDVRFWSGAPLTAADVVASWNAARYDEQSPYHGRMAEVGSIEALSDDTVRVVLTSPNIDLPRLLDIPIYRAGSATSGDFADGTGPYQPVGEGRSWMLEPNQDWHGGRLGSIRHITLVVLPRADAALSSFQTGDVSLMRASRISVDPPNVGGSVETAQTRSAVLHYLGLDHDHPALSDPRVRQALSAALPRQSLCDTAYQTFADPAVLPVNPQPPDLAGSLSMDADHARAARLLRQALGGADDDDADTDPDDIDDDVADDEPAPDTDPDAVLLTLRLLVNEENPFKVAAAEQIAASWNAIGGVRVTVEQRPFDTYLSMLRSGDFDVYYGETQLTADLDLRPLVAAGGRLNYGGCGSRALRAAVAAARRGEDVAGLHRLFAEELPFLPLAFERGQIILRKGLIDDYAPAPYNAFAGAEDWRIAQ